MEEVDIGENKQSIDKDEEENVYNPYTNEEVKVYKNLINSKKYILKVVVIGDSGVGKTSLV